MSSDQGTGNAAKAALAHAFSRLRTGATAALQQRFPQQQQQQQQQQHMASQWKLAAPPLPPPVPIDVLLSAPVVDLKQLRAAVSVHGAGDTPQGQRLAVWQLLLGVAPLSSSRRAEALAQRHAEYVQLAAELTAKPQHAESDHPLSTAPTSAWAAHFKHTEVREQIERDVDRTQRELAFFSCGGEAVRHALCRALYVFAATNGSVKYVQGMNEILAVFLYVAAAAHSGEQHALDAAESSAFNLFLNLLAELRDLFCSGLDATSVGVAGTLARLTACISTADPGLATHLASQKLHPQYFAFRWITTALSQEFMLPDVLRVWDFLFACPHGPLDALLRVCAAMVLRLRTSILAQDFATNLKMLQSYPHEDSAVNPTSQQQAAYDDVSWILRCAQQLPSPVPEAILPADSAAKEEDAWEDAHRASSRSAVAAAAAAASAAWSGAPVSDRGRHHRRADNANVGNACEMDTVGCNDSQHDE